MLVGLLPLHIILCRTPLLVWFICAILLAPCIVEAQPSSGSIVLGQSCALSGPAKNFGLDDGYEPDKAVRNTLRLINEDQVFLLIGEVGKPDHIGITMHSEKDLLEVKIIDNGEGFDTFSARKGMGLHTMEYRAKAIGADLRIESTGYSGTAISVSREMIN